MTGNTRFAASVHMLAYLAYRHGAAVPSAELAGSLDTHPVVIRRLLSALVRAGLVSATKGASGGFTLAHRPESISLRDVYRAVEPAPNRGLKHFVPNHRCPVGAKIEAILHGVYAKAQAGMEAELTSVSLADVHHQLQPVCRGKN